MKTTLRWLLLLSLLAAPIAVACGGGNGEDSAATPAVTAQAAAFPVMIEQSDGQKVTVAKAPARIVSLSSTGTEIFCQFGMRDQLVAVDRYANCPGGTKEKPELDGFRPNLEAIVGYKPDLVFVNDNRDNIIDSLRRADITVVYLKVPSTLNGVLDQLVTFGKFTGKEKEAATLTATLRDKIDAVAKKAATAPTHPRAYVEIDPKLFSASPKSFIGDFLNVVGAQNIAADSPTDYPQLSAEVIVQRDPEVIILAETTSQVTPETVKARSGWSQMAAIKNNRICQLDPDVVSRPGVRIGEALDLVAKCVYPDLFR